jgi:DNA polymerase-1
MANPDLVLIDGSSYLYRAFHALPKLTNSKGEPTGALHGVLNMINKLVREQSSAHVVVVFDAPGKTFRDELYADYKANRPPMPDELRSQIEPILDTVKAMGLPLLSVKGVEADDVIGTLCRLGADANQNVLVSTGDKDMAQLVSDKVTLVNTMNDSLMDRDGVKSKFDVWPEQIIDYLALVGDTSDNIPGVPKVGAKTAAKWLNQYASADQIIEKAEEIKGAVGESLRNNVEQLRLSRELATIRLDVDLPVTIDELAPGDTDTEGLRKIYSRYELRTLLRQLDEGVDDRGTERASDAAEPTGQVKGDYETVLSWDAFDAWLEKILAADLVAFDTETTSLNYMEAEIVGVSVSVKAGEAAYIPVAHDYMAAPQQLPRDEVLAKLKPFLESSEHKKVGHHLKYDAHVLARYDIALAGMAFDSMLESYVLNSVATRHDMDSTARHYLGHETIHYTDVAGKGVKQLTFNQIDLDIAAPYAAEDADVTLRLHEVLWAKLGEIESLRKIYEDIEQPLVPVLLAMEETGVLIDKQMLTDQSHELAKKVLALEEQAHELAGGPFNLGSPKQLQQILFEKLELPIIRKTPKGQPSTAEDVLVELANDYELPRVIMDFRSLSKLKSTYTDKLPLQIAANTGRLHTSYHQAVAATGRLSSTDPNLQNIPIRTSEGRRIRQAFIAPQGYLLLAADYSQIELRIMAHLSQDKGLLKAFADGQDVHRATAAEVFGASLDDVTPDQRRSAKAINFGLMYGMSAFGLAKQLEISRGEAQEYVNLYFDRYPGVKKFMENIRETAREQGYVETVFGRRLYLPEINARNAQRRQYAERTAINAPMQGTAADIIKRAMITVQNWLLAENVDARMIMQVHDELVFEVAAEQIDAVRGKVIELMSQSAELAVPLIVDAGVGTNWDEAH